MLDRPLRTAVVLLALLWVLPTPLRAEESFESRIEDTWEAPDSKEQAREKIDEAIDEVVSQMIFFKRPFARGELQEATEPCDQLQIGIDSKRVTIQCDDIKPTTSKKDGTSTEWTDEEGETFTLSQEVQSDEIVQTFESDRGTRTNTYSLEDEETLLLEVKLEGSQLPEPLTYERTFDRAE
jgi:hypothetical protein